MFVCIAFMVFVVSGGYLSVEWAGPYCFVGGDCESVFTCAVGGKRGVYLWAIPFWDRFLVYYVGETGVSFAARMQRHAQAYLSGVYRVFDPEEFAVGRKVIVWGGMWKRERQAPRFMADFLERYVELAPKIARFIGQLRLFLAPLEGGQRLRERIESAVSGSLKAQAGLVGCFQDEDVRYKPRLPGERPLRVVMVGHEKIMGLPPELVV